MLLAGVRPDLQAGTLQFDDSRFEKDSNLKSQVRLEGPRLTIHQGDTPATPESEPTTNRRAHAGESSRLPHSCRTEFRIEKVILDLGSLKEITYFRSEAQSHVQNAGADSRPGQPRVHLRSERTRSRQRSSISSNCADRAR